ncbi:MAG: AP2 domain-containing protein [Acidithiobacillus sp.]
MIEIPLTQNQIALIDDEDFELVSRHKWCAAWSPKTKSFYAKTTIRKPDGKETTLRMHRLVMNAQPGMDVDHIYHLTLDNRKSELRVCTRTQNRNNSGKQVNNTSGYKGVSWHKRDQKWTANIRFGGKKKHLGNFPTPEDAHGAYCRASAELHGEFARIA